MRIARRANKLQEQDLVTLNDLGEVVLKYIESNTSLDKEARKEAFLGANQLLQHVIFRAYPYREANRSNSLSQKLTEIYGESKIRIKEWEAQFAENRGFWHREQANNSYENFGIIGDAAAVGLMYFGAKTIFGEEVANHLVKIPMGAFALYFLHALIGNKIMILLQDSRKGGGPNFSGKLVTNGHYKLVRHPLYAADTLVNIVYGMGMLNPYTLWRKLKQTYHNFRACEEQDLRLRILFDKEAEEYQSRVPAIIPGSNRLGRLANAILPKNIYEKLHKPATYYLKKIPGIGKEPKSSDYSYKGKANGYGRSSLEPSPIKEAANDMKDILIDLGSMFACILTLGKRGRRFKEDILGLKTREAD